MTTKTKVKQHSKLPDTYLLKPTTELFRDKLEDLDKETRKKIVLQNPAIFGEYYIKPFTRKWNSNTANHHYYMLEKALESLSLVIHVPVEHAKSTWFSLVLPLYFICRDCNTQGCILSNTSRQAEGFLRNIKWHIEYNPKFKEDFGDYIIPHKPTKHDTTGKWTNTSIIIKRDKEFQSKDPTITAIGTGGAIMGARLDWVIADDIIDLKNSQTEILRKKVEDWWLEIIDARVIDGGRKILLGTLQHTKDLLCTLSDNKDYCYVHLSALDDDGITTLWPEQWPLKRVLAKKDSIGTLKFNKTLQNDRASTSAKLLDPNWLNYYDNMPPRLKIYIGIDPAVADDKTTAESKRQDKFGLAVIGFDGVKAYLIEEFEDWLTFPEQLKLVDRYNRKYKPYKMGVESVQYQRVLAQQAFILGSLPPIMSVNVGTQSKATRIESFSVYCETKRFWINKAHKLFENEFLEFEPGGKSPNILDACCVAMIMIHGRGSLKDVELVPSSNRQVNEW
jgi:phage terminase large subunit-like protein